jgi:catechol 2,3-dioxygenase-like lactoylglutathione lyase family enzyme
MPTRFTSVVVDSADPPTLARWWAEALGWKVIYEDAHETDVGPPEGEPGIDLVFVPVSDPKTGKNRLHLDLADPEGNELCVLEYRDSYVSAGALASVVVDAADPARLARFYAEATGWPIVAESAQAVTLRDPGGGHPDLDFVLVPDVRTGRNETGKNRLHLDVRPLPGSSQSAEVDRLRRLGAAPLDVGQGPDVTWVVLADPEGNALCVLSGPPSP